MITLQYLFDILAQGDLSQTKVGSEGQIKEENYYKLLLATNLGLTELYKRFNLRQNTVQLQQHPDVNRYFLREEFLGDSGEMGTESYLIYDDMIPLEDDFIKILGIYDEGQTELRFNDSFAPFPIISTEPDCLVMVPFQPPQLLSILYQANFPIVPFKDNLDPSKVELVIPNSIIQPLVFFIAASIFRGMNSSVAEGAQNPAITFAAQYELACQKIDLFSLDMSNDDTGQQFRKNGWR